MKQTERPHPMTPFIRGWVVFVAVGYGFIRQLVPDGSNERVPGQGGPWWVILAGVLVVAVLSAAAGFVSWYFTKFVIDDEELRIETGWLSTTSKRIAFSRIQSVDILQPLAARMFGLCELKIDAGGSASGGARLRYLRRDRAYRMRDYLLARAHGRAVGMVSTAALPQAGAFDDLSAADTVIVRIGPDKLILGALVSLEVWIPLLIVIAYFVLALLVGIPLWSGAFAILPMAFGLVGFVSKRVITQFNYTLAETTAGLRISRGLANLVSQSVPVKRIQGISIHQPLTWRPLGLYRVQVDVLGSGPLDEDGGRNEDVGLLIPAGTAEHVTIALQRIWPGVDTARLPLQHASRHARWLRPIGWRYLRYGFDGHIAVAEQGWLEHVRTIIPHARTQSVSLHQGPLQRRLGMADVHIHSTPGPVNFVAHHLPADAARAFALSQLDRARDARRGVRDDRPWGDAEQDAPDWRALGLT